MARNQKKPLPVSASSADYVVILYGLGIRETFGTLEKAREDAKQKSEDYDESAFILKEVEVFRKVSEVRHEAFS